MQNSRSNLLFNSTRNNKTPPLRRKACGPCFKSKRRCDQQLPTCSRCERLHFDCQYLPVPLQQQQVSTSLSPLSGSPPKESLGIEADQESYDALALPPNLPVLDDVLHRANDIDLNFLDANWDEQAYHPLFDVQRLPEYSPSSQQSVVSTTTNVLDHVSQDMQNEVASRLQYAITALKRAPSQMVLENATPWSHLLLYKNYIPRSMSDAYAACAMYMNKNDTNRQMVFRAIDTRAAELLSAPQNVTPVENLARVQALLLYQIIRLYDGDIRFHAQGEAAISDLEHYNHSLLELIDNLGMSISYHLPLSPELDSRYNASQPPFHATWIFQESCRRTLHFSHFFLAIYHILKGGHCYKHLLLDPGWTISAQLWNAPTEFDFKVAWREKKKFVIINLEYLEEVLGEAVPEEVDEFGKIFLVARIGLDSAREWFYERGDSL